MMQSLLANIKFELNIRYRSLSTYMYFMMFFFLSFLMALAAGGAFAGASVSFGLSNKVYFNTGLGITLFMTLLGAFSLFITAPAFGQAIVKDYANQFDQIIYSTPINSFIFLIGRFFAALLFMVFVLCSMGLGIWLATLTPFILKTSVTTNHIMNYVVPYLVIVIPNLFIFGSIFFLIATKTKKMASIYIAAILIFMGWMLSGRMLNEVENKMIGSIVDPFGISAVGESTKYWSIEEQNTRPVWFVGYLLYNRMFWLAIGLICFFTALFTFQKDVPKKKNKQTAQVLEKIETTKKIIFSLPSFNQYTYWKMFTRQIRFEFTQVFKSIYLQALVLAGVCYMFVAGQQVGKIFGTNTFPVTYMVLDFVGGSFDLFIIIIVTFLSGEIVWRDRDVKTQQVIDSYPVPNGIFVLAKFVNLVAVVATLLSLVMLCGVCIQAMNGYSHFEIGLYLQDLYALRLPYFVNLVALAFFFQVITNSKYLAHGCMIGYYIFYTWSGALGLEHKLYLFNATPSTAYSDMNGYGHFLTGYYLFNIYWMTLAALFMVLAWLFWQRGNLNLFQDRFIEFKRRQNRLVNTVLGVLAVAFILQAGNLFYNTNILNSYRTTKDGEKQQLAYEKQYSSQRYEPQLKVIAVNANVDLFPYDLKARLHYTYKLKNKTSLPIDKIFLNTSTQYDRDVAYQISFNVDAVAETSDRELGVAIYKFAKALAPNEEIEMSYLASVERKGVPNSDDMTNLVYNGTFFNNTWKAITIGYNPSLELSVTKTRAKYGLSEKERIPKIDNIKERQFHALSRDSSWIDFEATISTSSDQIAIAPGYLQKSWEENGRKFFHYKMDKKILNFYSFLSARYKVKKDQWKDVAIEIYYFPGHEYNIDKMIEASKASLEYFAQNYGPYQFQQYRVLEFPRYASFAQSFPNTVPFSEAIGFIAHVNPENPKDVDYPFFVTAHEFAHQYWGHQIIPAGVQGAFMPTESFAEYTALLVMEKKYGHEKMKRFLRIEVERYLSGRGNENEYESPLSLSEGQQYIHYSKGSIALFALKEAVGVDIVNSAIKEYLEKVKFQEAPFTVSTDFLAILKNKVQPPQVSLVQDLLEKIVLFENRPVVATYKKINEQSYEVHLKVSSTKLYADKEGKETIADFEHSFDIGVTDEKGEHLYLRKHKIHQGENEFVIKVNKEPAKAGIDPLNYIIDKNPDDNMMKVSEG